MKNTIFDILKGLIAWLFFVWFVFYSVTSHAEQCNDAKINEDVKAYTAGFFFKMANTNKNFTWTDTECERLWTMAEALAVKKVAQNLTCEVKPEVQNEYQ